MDKYDANKRKMMNMMNKDVKRMNFKKMIYEFRMLLINSSFFS